MASFAWRLACGSFFGTFRLWQRSVIVNPPLPKVVFSGEERGPEPFSTVPLLCPGPPKPQLM